MLTTIWRVSFAEPGLLRRWFSVMRAANGLSFVWAGLATGTVMEMGPATQRQPGSPCKPLQEDRLCSPPRPSEARAGTAGEPAGAPGERPRFAVSPPLW